MDEFFRTASCPVTFKQVAALQNDLDGWIEGYNFERPHQVYRNWGKLPVDTVIPFRKRVWEMLEGNNPLRVLSLGILKDMLARVRPNWPQRWTPFFGQPGSLIKVDSLFLICCPVLLFLDSLRSPFRPGWVAVLLVDRDRPLGLRHTANQFTLGP